MTIRKMATLSGAMVLLCLSALAQKPGGGPLSPVIQHAMDCGYAASVRIFPYDSVTNMQMGAPFSGVVVTRDGYILTAAHVTEPGHIYKVIFADGKDFNARGLGKITLDQIVPDVAMMKLLPAGNFPFAEMGRSAALLAGEPCVSIAYPESLFNPLPTVRFGRISQLKNEKGFIVSTCIMEPGDSGGPLFDCLGRVIALHSAVGVGEMENYEIPVDLYVKYWNALTRDSLYTAFPAASQVVSVDAKADSIRWLTGLKTVLAKPAIAPVVVNSGLGQIAGTLFDKNLVVSKSSVVGDPVTVLVDKKRIPATVIRRDRNNDLVLLRLSSAVKGGLATQGATELPLPGSFLVSPVPDGAVVQSVTGGAPYQLYKFFSLGSFGASVERQFPIKINMVKPASPADLGGIQVGDVIQGINGVTLTKAEDYGEQLTACWPGDTVTFVVKRDTAQLTRRVVLGVRPVDVHHPAEQFAGGPSKIRDGFTDKVFSHDAVLQPENCGGPVFDANGVFRGMNMARHSRASTMVMPAAVIYQFIQAGR